MKKHVDLKQVANKLKAVEELIEKNLLKLDLNNNRILIYSAILNGKPKSFKTNYIKSLYLYCGLKKAKVYDDTKTIQVVAIETDNVFATFLKDKVSFK